jgi:hypothetical protein
MSSYYQLAKSSDGIDDIFQRAFKLNLNPDIIDVDSNSKFVVLQITPDNLNKFDDAVKNLKINNIIFSTLDFENIIKYSFDNNIKIRNTRTNDLPEEISIEFNKLLRGKNSDELMKFVKENDIDIKELDISFETMILKIFDSGIFWTERDYSLAERIPKALFKNLLKLIV